MKYQKNNFNIDKTCFNNCSSSSIDESIYFNSFNNNFLTQINESTFLYCSIGKFIDGSRNIYFQQGEFFNLFKSC